MLFFYYNSFIFPLFGRAKNLLKNALTMFAIVEYYSDLNGYSLIPSWWRDRPNETQQPAI